MARGRRARRAFRMAALRSAPYHHARASHSDGMKRRFPWFSGVFVARGWIIRPLRYVFGALDYVFARLRFIVGLLRYVFATLRQGFGASGHIFGARWQVFRGRGQVFDVLG